MQSRPFQLFKPEEADKTEQLKLLPDLMKAVLEFDFIRKAFSKSVITLTFKDEPAMRSFYGKIKEQDSVKELVVFDRVSDNAASVQVRLNIDSCNKGKTTDDIIQLLQSQFKQPVAELK